jgi:hypothetical protein
MAVQYTEPDHGPFLRFIHQIMQLKYLRGNLRIPQEVGTRNELICDGRLDRALQIS